MSTIQISHVTKRYGPLAAVDDLSLTVPAGSVFGLLGPNGAGKTTIFKCLLGLARFSGDVLYDGQRLTPPGFERIAYVPERSVLYEWMTVTQHVEMARHAFSRFEPARAYELLRQFGIDPRKRCGALSKGMRTAVMVALAFARRAEILILDEPTSGLDPINQRHVLSLIVSEAARGNSVVFSSHQIGQVERAAERIAVLERGRLVLEGLVDDLKADRKIVEGILPDSASPLDGLTGDPRIARIDRTERIVRVLVLSDADGVAEKLTSAGASGIRTLDLGLEDIFLFAVSPPDAAASLLPKAGAS